MLLLLSFFLYNWHKGACNISSITSLQLYVKELIVEKSIVLVEEGVFHKIWQSPAPSKVIAFS
jgi:hypothetical protein